MKKICSVGLMMILSLALFQACNNSGQSSKETADSINEANKPNADDLTDFMEEAAIGGMMEVQLGQLAQQKASSQRVKDFGQMMVTDHSKANTQLKTLAASKNVVLPDSLSQDQQEDINDLRQKSGEEFDEAYMDEMVKDHKHDINVFQNAGEDIGDSDVKAFISQTLPVLQVHLDSAQEIQDDIKGNNDNNNNNDNNQ
jgi:putative membrane protein